MSVKQVLFILTFLILMGMVGIAIDQVNLLSILAFCVIVGIPLYVITNRSKFIHLWERKRRQDLINRYGFYETVETQKGKLIGDDMLGGVSSFMSNYTTFHLHTMVDCPFLINPHHKDETEYSCRLVLKSSSYNIEMKYLVDLLENKYLDPDKFTLDLSSSHYHCACMEWSGHIST